MVTISIMNQFTLQDAHVLKSNVYKEVITPSLSLSIVLGETEIRVSDVVK